MESSSSAQRIDFQDVTSDRTVSIENDSQIEEEKIGSFQIENEGTVIFVQVQSDDFFHCIQFVNQKDYEKK